MVDLVEVVSRAKLWASSSAGSLEVSCVKESERRIYLACQNGSFFVTVPENAHEEWVSVVFPRVAAKAVDSLFCRVYGAMRRDVLSV